MTKAQANELRNVKTRSELEAFRDLYEAARLNYNQYCFRCRENAEIGLPYDCLSKPTYCMKTDDDRDIIYLFEEMQDELLT